MTSKLQTTTDRDWLPNDHAGEMLVVEFMEPLGLSVEDLSAKIGVASDRLQAVIDGTRPMDAEIDLRLGRYFGMSEGFFLRLQDQYELLEAKRMLSEELDRITPRAA